MIQKTTRLEDVYLLLLLLLVLLLEYYNIMHCGNRRWEIILI